MIRTPNKALKLLSN